MRKFLLVGLLAVPLLALTEQRAAAWVKFGFSVNLMCGGKKLCFDGGQPPPDCSSSYSGPCCGAPMAYPLPHHPPAAHPPAPLPAPTPVQPTSHWQNTYRPASGYYPTSGYSNYQVPSYWYGN